MVRHGTKGASATRFLLNTCRAQSFSPLHAIIRGRLALRPHSKLLTVAARVGYGARGVVYLLIGVLAALAALDLGGQTVGTRGLMRVVLAQPAGSLWLAAIAAGIGCLSAWRLIQAIIDPSGYGRDWKGIGIRLALGGSAIVYATLAMLALRLLLGWEADDGRVTSLMRGWLAWVISAPLGPWMAAAIGLTTVAVGVIKIVKAWRADLYQHLYCKHRIRVWAIPVSRFGLTARGVVFVLIGGSIILAGLQVQADRAAGLAGVLRALENAPFGWVLLAAAALGLISFGIFGLIEAMYRRIEAQDVD